MRAAAALLARDLRLSLRSGGGASVGVLFFLIIAALMPFALGPNLQLLAQLGPAILWIAALLASLLNLDRLFQADYEDGALDGLRAGGLPLELTILIKAMAHWMASGLPLVVATPAIGILLNMPPRALAITAAALLIGTPAITLVGAVGAALTVSLRRAGLLLAIVILPLTVPILIFGVAAASAAALGRPVAPALMVLGALTLISAALSPFAAAAALRAAD